MNAPLGFRNAARSNYHLVPGAAGIELRRPVDAPATDHDGVGRPKGSAPDAGAFEDG